MRGRRGDLNGEAWRVLFERHAISANVERNGLFQISADQIKCEREPRLMTKFDDSERLPCIFKREGLGILPDTRGTYQIGKFDMFHSFENTPLPHIQQISPRFPLESIDYTELTSEALALNSAYSSGMLSHFLEEENLYPTISGRMGSSSFSFHISRGACSHHITVNNAQIEIDGGYEGEYSLALIEAKNHLANDFLVRQLYYPLRRWEATMRKSVRPIFLAYSNGIYHFREYTFLDINHYNSIELVREARYVIGSDSPQLTLQCVRDIIDELDRGDENCSPGGIIPQADDFGRVVNILEELAQAPELEAIDISEQQHFTLRQSDYYANAAIFLGLVQRVQRGNGRYQLTQEGDEIMRNDFHRRNIALAKAMLRPRFLRIAMKSSIDRGELISNIEICEIMRREEVNLSDSTVLRRAQTAIAWIKWLLENLAED